jgi:hypothetical protein
MKTLGLLLLIAGFLWLAFHAAFQFTPFSYTRWMYHSQHLPEGKTIPRSDAINAMRDLQLELKDQHHFVLLPAMGMLVGGLTAAIGGTKP